MYRQDYILRLIEQFARALVALRNQILGREAPAGDVRAGLREVADQAGIGVDVARRLDPGMLLMWLAPGGDVDPPRFWLMAELLYLEGLHARAAGAADAGRGDLERAHAVFSRLPAGWTPSGEFPPAADRVAEIARLLENR